MIEFIFSAQFLIGLGLGAVAGAFLGVLLGRRSKTANEYVDKIRAKYEEEREQLRHRIRELESSNPE
jgi:gas vesicle protein